MDRTIMEVFRLPLDNPAYAGIAAGVIVLGLLTSKLTKEEDPDIKKIRELIEHDSEELSLTNNITIRRNELDKIIGDLTFQMIMGLIILSIIVLIVGALTYRNNRCCKRSMNWTREKLKSLDSFLGNSRSEFEGIQLRMKIKIDKELEQLARKNKNCIDKEIKKIDKSVLKATQKIDNVVSSNVERIERVKQGFIDLIETDDRLKNLVSRLKNLEKSMNQLENQFATRFKKLDEQATGMNTIIHKCIDATEISTVELYKGIDMMKVNSYKCNIQLVNSKILFDAALSKFELVEKSIKMIVNDDDDEEISCADNIQDLSSPQLRLENCLESAIETRKKLDLLKCKKDNELSNSHQLSLILDDHDLDSSADKSSFEYFKIYSDTTDLAIADLNERLKKLEHKKPIEPQDCDQWVNNWISAMYGLFSSDIIYLQSQIFGDSKLKGLELFEETGVHLESDYQDIKDFVEECKEMCLKQMNSISLLVVESHMVGNHDDKSILKECTMKIELTVKQVFEGFITRIGNLSLDQEEKKSLREILVHFKRRLETDLKSAASEYLGLFRHNVDDFYLIQDSLVDLKKQSKSEESSKNSVSILSETAAQSENSFLSTSSWKDEKSTESEIYRPLKLVK
ncbi:hypothetical protein FOA43_002456 [Brettanomyces nanus]|uniref:Uncharacterized protein n=1 Tax=Eeniella nana TaxID=13502 RepID=A0A875S422_EENNA|nr:uncharacterized protein FOA43_002456 [Brettanomyces nanus]QPG75115.1 hypothetical protein FOA43_002456 [Brettanomyces nanus]